MKKKNIMFLFVALLLLVSCGELFDFSIAEEIKEEEEPTVVEIPNGWEIEKDSDYSRLEWNPDFRIDEDGTEITFTDSANQRITIKKDTSELTISRDNPKVTFEENKISLDLKGLRLIFTRKQQ